MTKEEIISTIRSDHQAMIHVVDKLTKQQKSQLILGDWTIREVIVHLTAWLTVMPEDIKKLLTDSVPKWFRNEMEEMKMDESFNYLAIKQAQGKSFDQIILEWDSAYRKLISAISRLKGSQISYQSKGNFWKDGAPMTVESLFTYKYEGAGHEKGHAKQIAEHFKIDLSK